MKIRQKLLVFVFSLTLIPLSIFVATTISGYTRWGDSVKTNILNENFRIIHLELSSFFQTRVRLISAYADTPSVKSMDYEHRIKDFYVEQVQKEQLFEKLLIGTPEGLFYNSSGGNPYQGYLQTSDNESPEAQPKNIRARDYWQETIKKDAIYASDPMISMSNGAIQIMIAKSVTDNLGNIVGMTSGGVNYVMFGEKLNEIMDAIDEELLDHVWFAIVSRNGRFVYNPDPTVMIHIEEVDGVKTAVQSTLTEEFSNIGALNSILAGESGEFVMDHPLLGEATTKYQSLDDVNYSIVFSVSNEYLNSFKRRQIIISIILVAAVVVVIIIGSLVFARSISKPITIVTESARRLAIGDFALGGISKDAFNRLDRRRDELGEISRTFGRLTDYLDEKTRIAERIAEGDLTADVGVASSDDQLGKALKQMIDSLTGIIRQVRVAADQVTSGSAQVRQASESLSQGASQQASSLEEVSSSLNQINGQSKQNAENATEANRLSKQAATSAENGNDEMTQLNAAMGSINASSDEIKKIVKVIDEIAFQINLLALNANVEAARAGRYGRGFAVVAEEVRHLAIKSASAVNETTSMVDESIQNIDRGNSSAQSTAQQLVEIVSGATRVAGLLEEIAVASSEQAIGIEEVTKGLGQIEQVTQANTASAEESAAASQELAVQARELQSLITRFMLKGDEDLDDEAARIEYDDSPEMAVPAMG